MTSTRTTGATLPPTHFDHWQAGTHWWWVGVWCPDFRGALLALAFDYPHLEAMVRTQWGRHAEVRTAEYLGPAVRALLAPWQHAQHAQHSGTGAALPTPGHDYRGVAAYLAEWIDGHPTMWSLYGFGPAPAHGTRASFMRLVRVSLADLWLRATETDLVGYTTYPFRRSDVQRNARTRSR